MYEKGASWAGSQLAHHSFVLTVHASLHQEGNELRGRLTVIRVRLIELRKNTDIFQVCKKNPFTEAVN